MAFYTFLISFVFSISLRVSEITYLSFTSLPNFKARIFLISGLFVCIFVEKHGIFFKARLLACLISLVSSNKAKYSTALYYSSEST